MYLEWKSCWLVKWAVSTILAPGLKFDLATVTNHLKVLTKCKGTDSVLCLLFYMNLSLSIGQKMSFNLSCMYSKLNLFSFNFKVLTYLRSPNWDTRIAAGQAVEAIVKNIPEWEPKPKPKEGELLCLFVKIFIYCRIWLSWGMAASETLTHQMGKWLMLSPCVWETIKWCVFTF